MKKVYEEEWYSVCCEAPPLYELDIYGEDPILLSFGMCMNCRDNTTFEIKECNEID